MFFVTFCGGSQVRPKESDNIVITMWGGTEIMLPTLAEKMMRIWNAKSHKGEIDDSAIRRTNVITLMGGTVYKSPQLGREIEDMMSLKDSGLIPEAELIDLFREALQREDLDQFESMTIMGFSGDEKPSVKEEIAALESIATKGFLSASEFQDLKALIRKEELPVLKGEKMQQKLRSLLYPVPRTADWKSPSLSSAGTIGYQPEKEKA